MTFVRPGQNKRQLAQRFGRILRPKAKSEGPQAYFYSLVSMDTQEIGNLTNRRDYLINQGFNFQVLTAERVCCCCGSQQDMLCDFCEEKRPVCFGGHAFATSYSSCLPILVGVCASCSLQPTSPRKKVAPTMTPTL